MRLLAGYRIRHRLLLKFLERDEVRQYVHVYSFSVYVRYSYVIPEGNVRLCLGARQHAVRALPAHYAIAVSLSVCHTDGSVKTVRMCNFHHTVATSIVFAG